MYLPSPEESTLFNQSEVGQCINTRAELKHIIYDLPSSTLFWIASCCLNSCCYEAFCFLDSPLIVPTLTQECLAAELSVFLPGHPTAVQKVTCDGEEGRLMHFKKPTLVAPHGQNVTRTEFLNLNINPFALHLSSLTESEWEASFSRTASSYFSCHSSTPPNYLSLDAPECAWLGGCGDGITGDNARWRLWHIQVQKWSCKEKAFRGSIVVAFLNL